MQWNGSAWKQIPDLMTDATTNGMAQGPNGAVWAVGYGPTATSGSVSMHWNDKAWQLVGIPSIGGFRGVAFIPGGTAWAVGWTASGKTLIAYWTGSIWQQVTAPSVSGDLMSVAATSPGNAWAVGYTTTGTLILHWNGTKWS
jgi:hypothetical protein